MAGRRRLPQTARYTPRQRAIEWGKDLLILLLTVSAVLLAGQTSILPRVGPLAGQPTATAQPADSQGGEAILPLAIAVRDERGLYGVSYDDALVERTFQTVSGLLSQGLSTAAGLEDITAQQWQDHMDGLGIYCLFQGEVPLSVLSARLGVTGTSFREGAHGLLLSWDGERAWLCWRSGDRYRRAGMELSGSGELEAVFDAFHPNGAAFASALAQSDDAYSALDPDVLVTMASPQPADYTVSSPDFVGDQAALEQLLTALGFQSGVNSAYQSMGDLAINESGDRLRVSGDGSVAFHAGEEARYPVTSYGGQTGALEAAWTAWKLLDRAAAPWKGEGTFLLTGVTAGEEGWTVTFHSRLDGIPVLLGEDGWCAQFVVSQQKVKSFTLTVRSYAAADTSAVLPSQRLAAAALRAMPDSDGSLLLCYSDGGGGALSAGWTTGQ